METALGEITLVLFTTIAPAGVAGYLVMLALAFAASDESDARRVERYLVVPLVFAITGLIASATHLGTPANALYVATGIGRSPLSNEVAAAVAFLALGGVYWFLAFRDDVPRMLRRVLAAAAAVAGVAFVAMIALAYSVSTVPTWNLPTGPAALCLSALASGPFVALLGMGLARVGATRMQRRVLLALSAAAAAANAVVLGVEYALLGGIATTSVGALDLVPWLPQVIVAFIVCEAAALALSALCGRRAAAAEAAGVCGDAEDADSPSGAVEPSEGRVGEVDADEAAAPGDAGGWRSWITHVALAAGAAAVSLAGCFAVRFAFYAMHMTSGM